MTITKKPILIAGVLASVGAAGLGSHALVSAATTSTTSSGNTSLVDKIAQRFNLKSADVQAVFDEDRATHEADRQARVEKDLTQAVTDGKITSEQKDKIIAKQKELQTQRETDRTSMDSKTRAERKAAMDAKKTELDQWAKDNGIPTEFLRYVMGDHGGHGHGMGGPDGR